MIFLQFVQCVFVWLVLNSAALQGVQISIDRLHSEGHAEIVSTGKRTGDFAKVIIHNTSGMDWQVLVPAGLIPPKNGYQGYLLPWPTTLRIKAGTSLTAPLRGYSTDVDRQPVPKGEEMLAAARWAPAQKVILGPHWLPPDDSGFIVAKKNRKVIPLFPGHDKALPYTVDYRANPVYAAPVFVAAVRFLDSGFKRLRNANQIRTPFSKHPERERIAVIQQAIWIFAGALKDDPYEKEDFRARMAALFEKRSGQAISEVNQARKEHFEKGIEQFWETFYLVSDEAKTIYVDSGQNGRLQRGINLATSTPLREKNHTPRVIDIHVGEAYQTAEERREVELDLLEEIVSVGPTHTISIPPSTAFALWRRDHIGGVASAVATKDPFWTTEPIQAGAEGKGTHSLSFEHGDPCLSRVAGAALAVVQSSYQATESVEGKALAMGSMEVTVGNATQKAEVLILRDMIGESEGKQCAEAFVSDFGEKALTSTVSAKASLEAGVTGEGEATARLESLYATILIGMCQCRDEIQFQVLTDFGLFRSSSTLAAEMGDARANWKKRAKQIRLDLETGILELDGESLKARCEQEVRGWAGDVQGNHFKCLEGE